MHRQIIAIGGGGFQRYHFSDLFGKNLLIEAYVLRQSDVANPKICFIPTASGESERYIANFYASFSQFQCRPSHLSLFCLPTKDLEDFILEQDVIYVGGGNTMSMLALWKEWGVGGFLKSAWENGTVMSGISAGAICWFEQGLTDSIPGELRPLKCLGLLRGSCCPHYDGEKQRRPTYTRYVAEGSIRDGVAIQDGAAAHFVNDALSRAVCSEQGKVCFRVSQTTDGYLEEAMACEFLGTEP